MRLDQEVGIGVGALLLLQLLTAFAAIGLFTRMTPAVEHILEENVSTLQASEEMLGMVAAAPDAADVDRVAFGAALNRAWETANEEREQVLVDRVAAADDAAFAGDLEARAAVVDALRQLAEVNRESMMVADQAAQELGRAGAWATAFLGLLSFIVGQVVYRRLRDRLERPILDADDVLESVRRGDIHRRCAHREGPRELQRIARNLNWLLDHERAEGLITEEEQLRAVLLHLLDQVPRPTLVIDPREGVLALNQDALTLLDADTREGNLLDAVRSGREPPGWEIRAVGRSGLRLAQRVVTT